MNKENRQPVDNEEKKWKIRGKKALIVNIIFFLILAVGLILGVILGFTVASVFIVLAFIASIIYIYFF